MTSPPDFAPTSGTATTEENILAGFHPGYGIFFTKYDGFATDDFEGRTALTVSGD